MTGSYSCTYQNAILNCSSRAPMKHASRIVCHLLTIKIFYYAIEIINLRNDKRSFTSRVGTEKKADQSNHECFHLDNNKVCSCMKVGNFNRHGKNKMKYE